MRKLFLYFFLALTLLPFSGVTAQEGGKTETVQREPASLTLTVSGTTIRVQNATPNSKMEVYDILGVKITSVVIDTADKTVTLNLPKGYYIFKIGDIVRKVVIK
ncbi:T9SS type A sorting domain-containing protein [Bacteroides sp.]